MTTIQEIMKDVNGTTFISLDTITPVKLRGGKSNPLQGRVTKVVTGSNVMVFQNKQINGYQAMVQRRLEKEGKVTEFTLSPRAWGERVKDTPFVEHNGNLYLEVIFLKCGDVKYLVDGEEFFGDIEGLDVGEKVEAYQGGLDDKVIIRTYKVENITAVTINKQQYKM